MNGSQRFFKTKRDAQIEIQRINKHYSTSSLEGAFDWTVGTLVTKYLAHIKIQKVEGRMSQTCFDDRARHAHQLLQLIVDEKPIGKIKANEITRGHFVLQLIPQIAVGRARKTVSNIMGSVVSIFDYAQIAGSCGSNESENISLNNIVDQQSKDELVELHPEIIGKILDEMDDGWKLITFFAAATGLRQGEQRAFTWGDIIWDKNKIRVNKAIKHRTNFPGAPKTPKGNRTVNLVPDLKQKLQALYFFRGRPADTELVFTIDGSLMNPMQFRRRIITACQDAGVNQIRWHDLRHFFASRMLQKFPNDMWRVSNLLGHEKTEITQKTYGHWLDEDEDDQTLDTMSDAFAFAK